LSSIFGELDLIRVGLANLAINALRLRTVNVETLLEQTPCRFRGS
jgi:hypothetical protein